MAKILIAEDDKFLANAYRAKFSKGGFEVQIAEDGEEVLSMLQTFTPAIILLDLVMPKLDGFATLEQLKLSEQFKKIPVIIASNLGQREDIERGMKLGAVDFVTKSDMSLDGLLQKVTSVITPS